MMRDQGAAEGAAPQLLTMSTGVVFRRGKPSSWALTEVGRQMAAEAPKVPVLYNEDKGRSEPNDADPDYQAALSEHQTRIMERQYAVIVATGTAVESIPEGFPAVDSEEWVEMLDAIGIPCPPKMTKMERYLCWVKYVAAPLNDDWLVLYEPLVRQIGTTEADVAAATETFPGDAERAAD